MERSRQLWADVPIEADGVDGLPCDSYGCIMPYEIPMAPKTQNWVSPERENEEHTQ